MRVILGDVDWTVPDQYESGVYKWTIIFNIVPIPFISGIVATLIAQRKADEETLNQILRDQGVVGTATLISKNVTLKKEWWGTAVSRVTIDYTVAFTPDTLGTLMLPLNHRTALVGFWLIYPFIPLLKLILTALIIGMLIVSVQSIIKRIFGPFEYTPYESGDCAEGWVYDAAKNKCVRRTGDPIQTLMIIGGLGLAISLVTQRGKG